MNRFKPLNSSVMHYVTLQWVATACGTRLGLLWQRKTVKLRNCSTCIKILTTERF